MREAAVSAADPGERPGGVRTSASISGGILAAPAPRGSRVAFRLRGLSEDVVVAVGVEQHAPAGGRGLQDGRGRVGGIIEDWRVELWALNKENNIERSAISLSIFYV